ncbi:MAG: hypothetical protein ACREA9_23520 [Pyrinomonadaceae bacterium]
MPGVITCPGLGEGDVVGICMPGVITCGAGEGDGDAVGICMPGVITCGLGEGEGRGLAALLVGVRLGRGVVLRFFGAAFGFGFAAGLGITCPSCCGNTLIVSANIKASALNGRSAIWKLLGRFMVPPQLVRQSER